MANQLSGHKMQAFGRALDDSLGGLGFCLITFEFGPNKPLTNYVSNAEREDMIKALKETVQRLEASRDFLTPNNN